jgi:hypothetical protein
MESYILKLLNMTKKEKHVELIARLMDEFPDGWAVKLTCSDFAILLFHYA